MGYSRVRFNNFRNIEPREIKWSPGLNLLTGPNGSGKTNILEGINIVSGWGPLERGTRSSSLPTWNSGSSEVQLTGQLDDESGEIIKVKISSRYTVRIDEKPVTATELRWKIPVLSFLPNDMSIIEGPASFRRRLMDMVLALIVPVYASRLNDYRRGIRQKTAILRNGGRTELIDRALLPLASWVWKMREEALTMISESMNDMCGLLPCPTDISLLRGGAGTLPVPEEDFRSSLRLNKSREEAMKVPMVGPHRDDILIRANGAPAALSLSRGFRRRTAIALILAAAEGVRRKLGKNPVLLLDEITAELDSDGRNILFCALTEKNTQVFASTAEPFAESFPGRIYGIDSGRVETINEN
ncbi:MULTISPECIES: DNA replication/repair protein RecF [Synergistaceae]|uniref:DNA replication/repair protein RecF n=1 Tax=Synergistaceae TaxID=649777 RepID=UPI003AEC33AA|nr:DNA replication and repair protein RecF [Synergistaceae bacterium DZ-S4]